MKFRTADALDHKICKRQLAKQGFARIDSTQTD